MCRLCASQLPQSQGLSICGPLFTAEETETPEGKELEGGRGGCSQVLRRVSGVLDLNRGRRWGPKVVWRSAISQPAEAHHVCSSKGHGDSSIPQSCPQQWRGSLGGVAVTGSICSCFSQCMDAPPHRGLGASSQHQYLGEPCRDRAPGWSPETTVISGTPLSPQTSLSRLVLGVVPGWGGDL